MLGAGRHARRHVDERLVVPTSSVVASLTTNTVAVSILTVSLAGGWVFGAVSILILAAMWKPVSCARAKVLPDLQRQGQWYRSASRQVRRLQAVIPGPINAHYGESVAGAAVIRAFGAQSVFVNGEP